MPEAILSLKGLTKHYGKVKAVESLTLDIPKGSVYGILGPNGSGKTTTLGMLLDVIQPKSGSFVWFGGQRGPKALRRVGAILEHPNFFTYLSGRDNLRIVADIKRVSKTRVEEVLDLVELGERGASRFKTYSLGMKQRLAIAAAMLNDPEVLVLDEPTNGLDPQGIAQVRELIRQIAARGVTILLASHLLDEVEKVCTHVAVMKFGQLLYAGEVDRILGADSQKSWVELGAADLYLLKTGLREIEEVKSIEEGVGTLKVFTDPVLRPEELNRLLAEKGIFLNHLTESKLTLEAQFLELTNQPSA